jgi:hypothetical protein
MEILSLIAKFLLAPTIFLLSLAGYTVPQTDDYVSLVQNAQMADEQTLGTTIANTVAGFETSLASSLTDSDTQMTLVSFTTDDGTNLTVGKQYAFTIDEGSASREFVIGTASSSNRIVNMVRGISVEDGATEIEANKKAHRRGASVKITNFQLVTITNILNDTATIPSPLRYASEVATTSIANAQHLASKAYVDFVAFNGAGVINASEVAKGVVELATQLEMASSTANGSVGPLVLQARYATSTGSSTGHWAVITNSVGKIAESFFASTFANNYTFSGSNTFSGTTTFSGATVGFGTATTTIFTSSGTWTKDPGLKYIVVEGVGGGGGCDTDDEGAGSAGGYFRKTISASDLPSTVTVTIGSAGGSNSVSSNATAGGTTTFGSYATSTGGDRNSGPGGSATGGDINISGQNGQSGSTGTGGNYSLGGSSMLGRGGIGGGATTGYGAGANEGQSASAGIVIVTEYY